MKSTITPTGNGTIRLFAYLDELPENITQRSVLFIALDAFSAWGGADKKEKDYISWEFDLSENMLRAALSRLNFPLIKNK